MKIIKGIKFGGLQMKIFNLVMIFIFLLVGLFAGFIILQQRNLSTIVRETGAQQQETIAELSEQTMDAILASTLPQTTGLQRYIADDLFADVRTDVYTLQSLARQIFENADLIAAHPVSVPSAVNDGTPAAFLIHEKNADPDNSKALGLAGNMSETMISIFEASDKLSSVFIGTADGNMVLVNEKSAAYIAPDGTPLTLELTQRPWFVQAKAAGDITFTGVEFDAYTDIPMIECAAPVYYNNGQLAAVVAADVYLDSITDYIRSATSNGGFLCIVDSNGHVLFSSREEGELKVEYSAFAEDLRTSSNTELAEFVKRALDERTGLQLIHFDGEAQYVTGVPMEVLDWTIISGVDYNTTREPTRVMLSQYDEINNGAMLTYRAGAKNSMRWLIVIAVAILVLANAAALIFASRLVRPLDAMTHRINNMRGGSAVFEMDNLYRTGDEVEVLAESFSTLTHRARDYIAQITKITAEKERIGTELALASRIQADMLPNIFPAFPERAEFDLYAIMDPAREVGGDFYDFFLIDEDHLGLVMADVSGKGVPGALFMMITKILVQNFVLYGYSPAAALKEINTQVCSNNREEMFITIWLGVLDIRSGLLTASNAGHEYPVLMKAGGTFEIVKDKHGFVVGGMENAKYTDYTMHLNPGDKLFLYTDGVPEASNAERKLFGIDRMLEALNGNTSLPPEGIIKAVRKAMDAFVQDAEQFDDVTMLCVEYKGPDATGENV